MMRSIKSLFKPNKIILLDIDGVIAPIGHVEQDNILVNIHWAHLVIPLDIIDFINEIPDEVKIVWASTWEDLSLIVSENCNFNIQQFITFKRKRENEWMKIKAIEEFVNANKKSEILFIDDDLSEDNGTLSSMKNLTLLRPDSNVGLSNADKKFIEEWYNN